MNAINKSKSLIKILCPVLIIVFLMLLVVFNGSKISSIANAFKPIIYAFIIAYLLDSIVRFCIVKLKVRRSQGILLACILMLGLIAFMFSIIVPKVIENINYVVDFILNENIDVGQIIENLRSKIDNKHLQYMADAILKAGESLQSKINAMLLLLSNQVLQTITSFGSKAFSMFTSFIISIYMLNEKDDLIARGKRLLYALYSETKANKIINNGRKANNIFKSFLNGKILDSFIVGAICILAFTIAQIKNAVLFGIVIGVFNIIPFFGPIIGAVPVVVVTFFIDPTKAITTLIIIIVIQQIDANYLDPRIVGNNVGVSPFWILTAVIVGGALGGVPGMIFGVPVVVLLKTILEEYIDMRLIEKGICDFEKDKLKVQKINKRIKKTKRDA